MEKNKDILYIVLHMPKCAGNTFGHHIQRNLRKEERLYLELDVSQKHKSNIDDNDFFKLYKNKCKQMEEYLSSLSSKQKDEIKVIYGHCVPYGIHKFFNKTPRYITFLRNPIDRTISSYNHLVTNYHIIIDPRFVDTEKQARLRNFFKMTFLINRHVPSFRQWLKLKYGHINQNIISKNQNVVSMGMVRFLKMNKYINNHTQEVNKDTIQSILNKFYFIGIVENNNEDLLFLFYELGIYKFYENKGISKKYVSLIDAEEMKKIIISKNRLDQKLYDCALEVNRKFKEDKKYFAVLVTYMKIKRILTLPFTHEKFRPLPRIYKLSAKLRQYSPSYSRFVDFVKGAT